VRLAEKAYVEAYNTAVDDEVKHALIRLERADRVLEEFAGTKEMPEEVVDAVHATRDFLDSLVDRLRAMKVPE
jgi:hypothetical protein